MLRWNGKTKEMTIKIIDWISRIVAVLLAVGGSCIQILYAMVRTNKVEWSTIIYSIIVWSILHTGLFLAPVVRQKGIICRLIIAIAMLPSFALFFFLSAEMLIRTSYDSLSGIAITMNMSLYIIICSMGFIIYLTQYNLLFGGVLFKPIYLTQCLRLKIFPEKWNALPMLTHRETEEDKMDIVIPDYVHWVNYIESFIISGIMTIGTFLLIGLAVIKRVGHPIYSPISPTGELTFRGWGLIIGIIILVGFVGYFILRYMIYFKINKKYPRIITLCPDSIKRIYYNAAQERIEDVICLGDIEKAYRTFHILYNKKSKFDSFMKFLLVIGFPLVIPVNIITSFLIILCKLLVCTKIKKRRKWSFYDSIIIASKTGEIINIGVYFKEDYEKLKGFFLEKLSIDIDKLPESWAHSYFFYRTDVPTIDIPLFFIRR